MELQDRTHTEKPRTWSGRRAAIYTELSGLREQQREALEHATYFGMSPSAAAEYEKRARRISELQRALDSSASLWAEPAYW